MYQRFSIVESLALNAAVVTGQPGIREAVPKYQRNDIADDLIGDQEEDRCERDHDQHHDRRDPDLFPGRPRHLRHFLTHLLDERQGISHLPMHLRPQKHAAARY